MPKPTGEDLRNQGIAQVLSHTPEAWKAEALKKIQERARRKGEFNFDDIRSQIPELPDYCHHNAIGGIMSAALSKKIIVYQGRVQRTSRTKGHARVVKLYVGAKFADDSTPAKPPGKPIRRKIKVCPNYLKQKVVVKDAVQIKILDCQHPEIKNLLDSEEKKMAQAGATFLVNEKIAKILINSDAAKPV